jgi:cytochrome c biogenesis protein CcdA
VSQILAWGGALAMLLGFALSMGSHPATYGATADMLARKTRWLPRVSWMSAGLITGATFLFVLFQFINPESFLHSLEGRVDRTLHSRTIDLTVGSILLLAAAAVVTWRLVQRELPATATKEVNPRARFAGYFVVGLSSSIVGFTTLPVMYLTVRVVSSVSPHLIPRVVAFAVFLFFLVAPFFALGILWTRIPTLAEKIYITYQRALHWDFRWLLAGFLTAAGVALLILGLVTPR